MANEQNKKRWVVGTVVAVAVAGAVSYFGFDVPGGNDLSGTIAPAERYRGEQLTDSDIQLGDQSIAQIMQTDVFERMVKDPAFRAMASDANFKALASQPAFAAMAKHTVAFKAMAQAPEAFAA